MCRRESAGVIEALCMAFPEMAAELLPGGQQQVRASLLIRPAAPAADSRWSVRASQLPLHAACVSAQNWIVPPMGLGLPEGGDDDAASPSGERSEAAAAYPAAVVSVLLAAHPEAASCADANGCYPLHLAARHSPSPRVVETLLAAHPEAAALADAKGNLPLHLAFVRPAWKPGAPPRIGTLCYCRCVGPP